MAKGRINQTALQDHSGRCANRMESMQRVTYSYTGVAATLRPWHLKLAAQQVDPVLLLTRTRVLQRAHAIRLGCAEAPETEKQT